MKSVPQEKQGKIQQIIDGNPYQIQSQNMKLACFRSFKTKKFQDTCHPNSLEIRINSIQLQSRLNKKKTSLEKMLKVQENIKKKPKKYKTTSQVDNNFLKEIQQIKTQYPQYSKSQYLQTIEILIKSLENVLVNLKNELLIQIYKQNQHRSNQQLLKHEFEL